MISKKFLKMLSRKELTAYEFFSLNIGVLLFTFGIIWYGKASKVIEFEYTWQAVLMVLGIVFVLKSIIIKKMMKTN